MDNRIKQQVEENYVLWNAINRIYGNWAKKNGMTYHSLFTLYTIHTNQQDCCQSTICDETSTPKQTVNSILKEFEKKNYIYYEKDEKDKRNKKIKLTDEGQVFASSILDPLFELETTVMEKMGSEQRQAMIDTNTMYYQLLKLEMERGLPR